ncbi:MAG: hypothetical protein JRN15_02430 [Nitrososphaerota archaeon]|nr:hypothetical protein [Nitrososphaerota archaeon]
MQPQGEVDLEALSQKIDSLASQRQQMINEYKTLDQRRREIRREIREFTEKINNDRKSLDAYYEQMTTFKANRRDLLSKIREMKTKSTDVEKVLKGFEKNIPRGGEALNDRLKKAEWRLQTERLTRDEEKQLVAVVKDLETKLKAWKKAYSTKQELTNVLDQIKGLKSKLDEMNKFRAENDPEVKAKHERVAMMLNQRHQLFQEIETINNQLIELDTNITKATQELDGMRGQRRVLLDGRKSRDYESNKAKTRQLVDRARDDARKKYEQGEKLSLDELKLVLGEDNDVMK